MRISGGTPPAYQAPAVSQAQAARTDTQYRVKVLKQALDSQKSAADQLLQLLDPKGKNLDIRA
jgi:hypothetical protein